MALPLKLKAVQPFLKVANDMRKKEPGIAYYCDMHAMQMAIKIDSKSPDCKAFLIQLMTSLEKQKTELLTDPETQEQISSSDTGQLIIEDKAMQLFQYADSKDRNAEFGKNVVRAFYTSSVLYDVSEGITGEDGLDEEARHHRKYARWKATYIHNCLKNGETPQAGPIGGLEDGLDDELGEGTSSDVPQPFVPQPYVPPTQPDPPKPVARSKPVDMTPAVNVPSYDDPTPTYTAPPGGVELSHIQFVQAQKLCKYAISAITYEDVPTAVLNLEKCIKLLKTGKEDL